MSQNLQQSGARTKGCFLFLIDQSSAMNSHLADTAILRSEVAATAINYWLSQLVTDALEQEYVRDAYDVGVFGYCTDETSKPIIRSLLGVANNSPLVSIARIASAPDRMEAVVDHLVDSKTRIAHEFSSEIPVWIEPFAQGGRPQCDVLYCACQALNAWIIRHRQCSPPIVIHISGGESLDGSPIPYASSLRNLATDNGRVMLLNCYLTDVSTIARFCPSDEQSLPDNAARTLFRMSSEVSDDAIESLRKLGFDAKPGARGLAINSDPLAATRLPPFTMGIRPTSTSNVATNPRIQLPPPLALPCAEQDLPSQTDVPAVGRLAAESDNLVFAKPLSESTSDTVFDDELDVQAKLLASSEQSSSELVDAQPAPAADQIINELVLEFDDHAVLDEESDVGDSGLNLDSIIDSESAIVESVEPEVQPPRYEPFEESTFFEKTNTPLDQTFRPVYDDPTEFQSGQPAEHQDLVAAAITATDEEETPLANSKRVRIAPFIGWTPALASAFLVAVGIGAMLTYSWLSFGRVEFRPHIAKVDELIENGELDEARRYVDELVKNSPTLIDRDDFKQLNAHVTQLIEERNRQAQAEQQREADRIRLVAFEKTLSKAAAVAPRLLDKAAIEKARELAETDSEFSQIDRIEKNVAEFQEAQTALESLVAAVGNVAVYRRQLNDFHLRFPETRRGIDFRRVIDEDLPLIKRIGEWNSLLDRWSAMDMRTLSPAEALELQVEAKPLLDECGQFPQSESVRERAMAVAAVANRVDDQGRRITDELVQLLKHPTASIPFVLQTAQGKRYYLTETPSREDGQLVFEYATNLDRDQRSMSIPRDEMDRTKSGRLAHAETAERALSLLAELDSTGWESALYRTAAAIHSESRIDPILKVQWLTDVLSIGCRGSQPLCSAFDEHIKLLKGLNLGSDTNWLDPDDEAAQAARVACDEVLQRLPDLGRAGADAAKKYNSLQEFNASRLRWVGFTSRNEKGTWQFRVNVQSSANSGTLFVVYRSTATDRLAVEPIGKIVDGVLARDTFNEEVLCDGRPVFVED